MKFEIITEKEYHDYWEKHPLKDFLSSPVIGKSKEGTNWQVSYACVKEKNKIIAACMLLSYKRKLNKSEFYSPRGLLVDYENDKLLNFFISSLKDYIKKNGGYELKIEPNVYYKQRDINGDIVEGGIDNTHIRQKLFDLGFKLTPQKDCKQIIWMFSLNTKGKTKDDILNEMKPTTRNIIRKTEKIGITIRELKYDELDTFYKILIETGARRNFKIRELSYYQKMYKLLHDTNEVKFLITEINIKDYLEKLRNENKDSLNKIENMKDNPHNAGKIKELTAIIGANDKRIKTVNEIYEKTGKDILTLSGSMFIMIKPQVVYLSSGNYEEYMFFNSQYLIQWEMIKYAIDNGFDKYNFYGIPADINTKPKNYGLYEFKKGFNGYVEELLGEFTLPITYHYYLFKAIDKLKSILKGKS
ncbi:MAG: peptidoglycan bridge formation glycyltransferase FemA/FemB family protein [Bacilli bacterium]|nr:peptidoglycan bridge formation glycyltransferase FemA/FemB family protein [Bacilli bacterium]